MEMNDSPTQSVVDALTKNYLYHRDVNGSLVQEELTIFHDKASDISEIESRIIKRQGFSVGDLNLMVAYEDGNQILDVPNIIPIPNSPNWFVGFSNVQGMAIPIFDVADFLDVESSVGFNKEQLFQNKQMLFIVKQGDDATGLLIDGLLKRMEFTNDNIQTNAIVPDKLNNSVNDSYFINEDIWFDLNCNAFLNELEGNINNKRI